MATILRNPTRVDQYRRPYHQVDPVPNLAANFFPKVTPFKSDTSTQPDRFWPRPPAQDFIQNSAQALGIPVKATDPNIFRAPTKVDQYRRPYDQIAPPPNLVVKTLIAAGPPPFRVLPDPEIYRRPDRDFMVFEALSYLPGPVIAPYIPVDFPTPMRARQTPQDFTFSSTGISPIAPFNQDDWPNAIRMRIHHQDFWWTGVTTRGIPTGVAEPFNQADWPTIPPRRWAQAENYASPRILLITPVLRPFSQQEWVNPNKFRPIAIDWPWAGVTTRGIPPVPAPSGPFDSVRLEAYAIGMDTLELHWSASAGAHGYRIYINGVPQTQELHDRIALVTGLAIDTDYTFNIVCVNAFGIDASDLSNTIPFRRDSREIGDHTKYPWGDSPQQGYVIKVKLNG